MLASFEAGEIIVCWQVGIPPRRLNQSGLGAEISPCRRCHRSLRACDVALLPCIPDVLFGTCKWLRRAWAPDARTWLAVQDPLSIRFLVKCSPCPGQTSCCGTKTQSRKAFHLFDAFLSRARWDAALCQGAAQCQGRSASASCPALVLLNVSA